MARPKTGDKPRDIRDATVGEVAAIGSTSVSVNKIAKRAGLSVGTLYRYHKSKHALLSWVFLEVKRDIHNAMMGAADTLEGAAARLQAMWFALVDYGLRAPEDFLFVEMVSAEVREPSPEDEEIGRIQGEVLAEIRAGIDEGVLVEAPVTTVETILASPAITLVRHASLSGTRPERGELELVFKLIWRGLSA
ncbi:MAG: TetR/AcrR family transcriptional regulator [Acidobacteriota bacterium]